MKPYAFLLAGHSNWGKSRTLRALTDGRLVRWASIRGTNLFIRRMSNDDWSEHYHDFIDSCIVDTSANLIVAFCPNFDIPERYSLNTLQRISAHYRLHILALRHQYGTEEIITDPEIETMEQFGEVRIYEGRNRQAPERAQALRNYIDEVIARG